MYVGGVGERIPRATRITKSQSSEEAAQNVQFGWNLVRRIGNHRT